MLVFIKRFLILIAITMILSCNNTLDSSEDQITEVEQSGGIDLSVPTMSSVIKSDILKTAFIADSRAVLGAHRVDYVITSAGEEVKSSSSSSDDFMNNSIYIELEPGDYSISVEVFNTYTSEDVPMVSGSEDFTVTADQITDVYIIAKPVNPALITQDDTLVFNSHDFTVSTTDLYANDVSVGSELWYKITPVSENLLLTLDYEMVPAASDFFFFIHNENGMPINSVSSFSDGTSVELFDTAGNTYYIGVIFLNLTGSDFISHLGELTVTMGEFIPEYTSIPVSEEWTDIILEENELSFFIVENLEVGKSYDVEVLDRDDSDDLEADAMFRDELNSNSYSDSFSRVTIEEGESSFEFYLTSDMQEGSAKVRVVEWIDPHIAEPMEGYVPYIHFLDSDVYDVSRIVAVVADTTTSPCSVVDSISLDYIDGQRRYVFYIPEYESYSNYNVYFLSLDSNDIVLYQDYGGSYSLEQGIEYQYVQNPYISGLSTPDIIFLGNSITDSFYINDTLITSYKFFEQYYEIDLTVEIDTKPVGSSLTVDDILLSFNGDTSDLGDVELSITPDVAGDYVIKLNVSNYYKTVAKTIEFSVASSDEGVLNVTFE